MSPGVHRQAAVGFDRAGADYERGRPGYPPAAIQKLADELGLGPGRTALDLAAGTGKLTQALAATDAELIAVEPVAGMRERLTASLPRVAVRHGTAEQIPLDASSVDAVLVAQAFHWFNTAAAATEIHRVLRPRGGLAVIWNSWDESLAWVARVQALVHEHAQGVPQQRSSDWPRELAATGLFTALAQATFPNLVRGDRETLKARVASTSYIATLAPSERERVLDAVAEVVAADPLTRDADELEMPYTTHVAWGYRLG